MPNREWRIREAKSKLSALILEAQRNGPQSITRHGRPVAVLVASDDYERLMARPGLPLFEFLASAPFAGIRFAERDRTAFDRKVEI